MRLAEATEEAGETEDALTLYEKALDLNPELVDAHLRRAALYAGPLGNPEEAIISARKARQLEPDRADVAAVLGKLAFDAGDFSWSYSLLREGAGERSKNPELELDLAWTAYSLGKVGEARKAMERLLAAAPESPKAEEAKTFLAMLEGSEAEEEDLKGAEAKAMAVLETDKGNIPALMVRARAEWARGDRDAAKATYEQILARFPAFTPGQKQLATIYAEDTTTLERAYELAVKVREADPLDSEFAGILAGISHDRGDFRYAIQLLDEIARKRSLNARELYWKGASHRGLGNDSEAKTALKQSLDRGLGSPYRAQAESLVSELGSE